MSVEPIDLDLVRRDSVARAVAKRWRELTGGSEVRDPDRRTLVACSGGADSTALALALAASGSGSVVIAHIVHDLREEAETGAERDVVHELAGRLCVPVVEAAVQVKDMAGNAEANARWARYRELERLALRSKCQYVATAHHAGDQLETMLMALVRGASIRGMAAMPDRRRLGERGIVLVRPMLVVERQDVEGLCTRLSLDWNSDPSNNDLSRLRSAVRHGPAKELEQIRPGSAKRAVETATQFRRIAEFVESMADALVDRGDVTDAGVVWARDSLKDEPKAVLGAALRRAYARLHGGRYGDSLPARNVREVVDAVAARLDDAEGGNGAVRTDGRTRRFMWKDTEVTVSGGTVEMHRKRR